jgi:hypothetical protein
MRERGWSVMKTVMLVLNLMYFLWNMIVASIYYADGQYTAWSSIAYLVVFITNLISMHFLWKRHTAGDWLCLVTAVLNFISIMLYIWDLNWTMGGMALLITITKITIHVLNLAFACHTLRERGNE